VNVTAKGSPPYKYERAGLLHLVLDARGMNCIRFPDQPGAVSFRDEDEARAVSAWLNGAVE